MRKDKSPSAEAAEAGGLRHDLQRYETLKQAIAEVGVFRRGSLVQISPPCGKPGCACKADPPRPHGPYWQWTFQQGGKTRTRYVRVAEKELFEEWMENRRRLDRLLSKMQQVSHRITEKILRQRNPARQGRTGPARSRGGAPGPG